MNNETTEQFATEPQVVVPVDVREMTTIESDQGNINIIHEITVGEVVTSTLMAMILIFLVISHVSRRFK